MKNLSISPVRILFLFGLLAQLLVACERQQETTPPHTPTAPPPTATATPTVPPPTATTTPSPTATTTPFPTATPAGSPTLELLPQWSEGERYAFEIIKDRRRTGTPPVRARVPVEIVVLEENANGYLLQWQNGRTEIDSDLVEQSPLVASVQELGAGMTMEYQVNHQGQFLELRNWEEIRALLQETLETLLNSEEFTGTMGEEELATFRATMEAFLPETRVEVEAFALDEIHVFHKLYGVPLTQGEAYEYESLHTLPLGAGELATTGVVDVVSYSPEEGRAVVMDRVEPDPEIVLDMIVEMLVEANASMGQPPPTDEELAELEDLEVSVFTSHTLDLASGWPASIELLELVSVGNLEDVRITRYFADGE